MEHIYYKNNRIRGAHPKILPASLGPWYSNASSPFLNAFRVGNPFTSWASQVIFHRLCNQNSNGNWAKKNIKFYIYILYKEIIGGNHESVLDWLRWIFEINSQLLCNLHLNLSTSKTICKQIMHILKEQYQERQVWLLEPCLI